MSNITNAMEANWNLTKIATGSDIVNNPAGWLQTFDGVLGNFMIITFMGVIMWILFLSMRNNVNNDTEALSYSGLITVIAGIFLFVIDTGTGTKLISWGALLPFIVITAFAFFMNFTNRPA